MNFFFLFFFHFRFESTACSACRRLCKASRGQEMRSCKAADKLFTTMLELEYDPNPSEVEALCKTEYSLKIFCN